MSVKKLKRFEHKDPYMNNFFTCLNYKDTKNDRPYIQIAAFDPGVINTGCRIEKREIINNKCTVTTIQQKLFISGSKKNDTHYFITMRNHLYSISKDLYNCDYILIESQMKNNPEAIRMSQHIISTLLCILEGSNALLIEILPTVKSRSFGIKGIKGKELKKWAVEKSLSILTERNDHTGQTFIKECKKKDDHGDVVLYCDAWYRYLEDKNFNLN